MAFEIDISNDQSYLPVDIVALRRAVATALHIEQVHSAVLSISIVDNAAIHCINRLHLQHDFPTDVISFQLDFRSESADSDKQNPTGSDSVPVSHSLELRAAGARIEGEIIVSAQMALEMCAELSDAGPWTPDHELTLYIVHGLLHICGYDDMSPEEKRIMRLHERLILNSMGLHPSYPGDQS